MWILLAILGGLAAVVTVVLLLPVYVIIKSDEKGNLMLRYRFLNKIYGEEPNPDDPIVKALKKSAGIQRLEKNNFEKSVKQGGVSSAVTESVDLILSLLRQLLDVLRYCTAKRFCLHISCAGEDPAQTAMTYGKYCAAVYPLLGLVSSKLHIPEKGRDIRIECEFSPGDRVIFYDILIRIRVFYVLRAFLRIAMDEVRRIYAEGQDPASK